MNIIPLGTFCQLAGSLERMKLRGNALPFDYIRSNPKMVIDCIINNFSAFLDQSKYFKHNNTIGIEGYGCDVFVHPDHNIFDDDVYQTFKRRSERFIEQLDSPNRKLFMILFQPWGLPGSALADGRKFDSITNDLRVLYELLKARTCNFKIIVIFNTIAKEQKFTTIEKNQFIWQYNVETLTSSRGYLYSDKDEKFFVQCLKQIIEESTHP